MLKTAQKQATDSSIDDFVEGQDSKAKPKKGISKKVMSIALIPVAYLGVQLADYVKSHVTKEPIGIVYAGEVLAAEKAFGAVDKYAGMSAKELSRKGQIAIFKKDYETAFEFYIWATKKEPSKFHYKQIASCLNNMDRPNEALEYATKSHELDPCYSRAYTQIAVAYEKLDYIKKAQHNIQKALRLMTQAGERPQKEFHITYNRIMSLKE